METYLEAFLLGNAAILGNVCMLPLYPGLSNIDQRHVIDAVNAVAEELR
mgnify:CR=1 FL=1